MNYLEAAKKLLETILQALDITVDSIEIEPVLFGNQLQVVCDGATEKKLIRPYSTFREIENKLNELLSSHFPEGERVRLDCNHQRNKEEKSLKEKVQSAIISLTTANTEYSVNIVELAPMNAYHRRMVYHWLELEAAGKIEAVSDSQPARLKKITLKLKG